MEEAFYSYIRSVKVYAGRLLLTSAEGPCDFTGILDEQY